MAYEQMDFAYKIEAKFRRSSFATCHLPFPPGCGLYLKLSLSYKHFLFLRVPEFVVIITRFGFRIEKKKIKKSVKIKYSNDYTRKKK